jgi:LPS O-antigen subunit length determinant protein (WzzB/FepE family)
MKENEIYEDEIDLFDLLDKLNKQKKLIIGITAISTILAIIISLMIPKVYKAEVFFEVPIINKTSINNINNIINDINNINNVINISEIQEIIKSYPQLKNIKILPVKNSPFMGKIEIESKSPENAKKELETAINIINNDILPKKREEVSQILNLRYNLINKAILEINSKNQIIYDPTKVVDLLTEKEQIEKWLKNPNWILPTSEIQLLPDPIRPKPLIYTAIGFIGGLFLGIFIALLKDAIQNRKRENV